MDVNAATTEGITPVIGAIFKGDNFVVGVELVKRTTPMMKLALTPITDCSWVLPA